MHIYFCVFVHIICIFFKCFVAYLQFCSLYISAYSYYYTYIHAYIHIAYFLFVYFTAYSCIF